VEAVVNSASLRLEGSAGVRPAGGNPGRLAAAGSAGQTDRADAPVSKAGRLIVLLGVAGLLILAGVMWSQYDVAAHALRSRTHGRILMALGWLLIGIHGAALLWRIVLAVRYRPVPPVGEEELPVCTVIVPAYNEGRQVLKTLRSIAASDYPRGKLWIVAVDDGSRDDTWEWIRQGAREFPDMVLARRQPVNRGKRWALWEGFKHARGEILVTIDGDSEVEPQTLRHLVSPFLRDERIGGVAGNVRILNRREGLIPRMLEVSFAFSFDFIRAGQSQVNTVLCTPGALSAYRRDLVMKVLPEWIGQRFCGRPADIGEDRAMTSLILRDGHLVQYQQSAVVHTQAPTRYRALCRMFLRWARSNIRETIVLSRFAFRRFRPAPATGARINLLLQWVTLTLGQLTKLGTLVPLLWMPGHFLVSLAVGAAVMGILPAAVYALRYRSAHALWAFPYNVFWTLGLSWIALYAWLTPQKTGWLTRGLTAPRQGLMPAAAEVIGRHAAASPHLVPSGVGGTAAA